MKRLVELHRALADEREIVLRSYSVEHQAHPSGSLTTHVHLPGERVRLPRERADDLVRRGLAVEPPSV